MRALHQQQPTRIDGVFGGLFLVPRVVGVARRQHARRLGVRRPSHPLQVGIALDERGGIGVHARVDTLRGSEAQPVHRWVEIHAHWPWGQWQIRDSPHLAHRAGRGVDGQQAVAVGHGIEHTFGHTKIHANDGFSRFESLQWAALHHLLRGIRAHLEQGVRCRQHPQRMRLRCPCGLRAGDGCCEQRYGGNGPRYPARHRSPPARHRHLLSSLSHGHG